MPRKVDLPAAATRDASSDLSPPPTELEAAPENTATTPQSKKRKRGAAKESAPTTPTKVVTKVETAAINGTASAIRKKVKIEQANGTTIKVEENVTTTTPGAGSRKRKAASTKPEHDGDDKKEPEPTDRTPAPGPAPKKKRATKADKAGDAMVGPLAARTTTHAYRIGAHVSASGGVHNAVEAATHIGANAFALFLKSQRKWTNPALSPEVTAQFLSRCSSQAYDAGAHVVPHGSYLVNLAHTDPERTRQAYASFLDDLKRCEALGVGLYNFHPGNVQGVERRVALEQLAANLNRAHKETEGVVTLLENMAATGGNVIGCRFEELGEVIEMVEDKARVGVCLDTCHAFAAGYDLKDAEGLGRVLGELDEKVGLKYLRALHLNDSKAPLGSGRDLHANIGTGFIGLKGFHAMMNEERLRGLPMVLETPTELLDEEGNAVKDAKGLASGEQKSVWAGEIKLLESMTDMDIESEEFQALETSLATKGKKERDRIQDQVSRRGEKKPKGKSRKKKKDEQTSDEEST